MADDATTIETRTTTTVDPPPSTDESDGVLPDPRRLVADLLWLLKQLVLGAGIVWILAVLGMLAFTPDSPKGVVDAATLVAVLGLLITSFMAGFSRRQN